MLTDVQRSRLQRYLDELERFNRAVNMTRVEPDVWWSRHIDESVDVLDAVAPPPGARVVDVGSGSGIPGVPMALLRDDISMTLVEADQRKSAFLVHACGLLEARNVVVVAERAEVIGHDDAHREQYDVAVSRATAPLPVLVELCLPLVKLGGMLAALVSPDVDLDAAVVAAAACGGGAPAWLAPGIVSVPKTGPTPADYPRRVGVPAKKPLGQSD